MRVAPRSPTINALVLKQLLKVNGIALIAQLREQVLPLARRRSRPRRLAAALERLFTLFRVL